MRSTADELAWWRAREALLHPRSVLVAWTDLVRSAWPTGGTSPLSWDFDACALAPLARARPGILQWEDILLGAFKALSNTGARSADLPIWIGCVREGVVGSLGLEGATVGAALRRRYAPKDFFFVCGPQLAEQVMIDLWAYVGCLTPMWREETGLPLRRANWRIWEPEPW